MGRLAEIIQHTLVFDRGDDGWR